MVTKHSLLKMVFAGMFLSNGLMFAETNSPGVKLDYRLTQLTERALREQAVGAPSSLYEALMGIRNAIDEKTMEDFGERRATTNPEASFIYAMGQRKVCIYYAHCKDASKGEFESLDRIDDKGFTALAPNLTNRYGNEAAKYLLRMMMAISDKRYVMHLLGVEDLEGLKIKQTFYLETAVPYHYKLGGAVEMYEKLNIVYGDQQKCDVLLSYTFKNMPEMPADLVRVTYWGVQENGRTIARSKSGLILYQGQLVNPTDEIEEEAVNNAQGLQNAPVAKRNTKAQQATTATGRRHHRRGRPVNNANVRNAKNVQARNVNRQQQQPVAVQEVAPAQNSNKPHAGGRNNRHWRSGYSRGSARQNQVLMEAVDEDGNQLFIIDNTPTREVAPRKPRHGFVHLSSN